MLCTLQPDATRVVVSMRGTMRRGVAWARAVASRNADPPPTYTVMAAQQPSPGLEAGQTPATPALPAPPAPMSELREDVQPLGEALKARAADVLDLTAARTR